VDVAYRVDAHSRLLFTRRFIAPPPLVFSSAPSSHLSPHHHARSSLVPPRSTHSITFLRASETNNSVPEDSLESLQVAQQCLADAFGLDPDSVEDEEKYAVPEGLQGVWEKFQSSQSGGKTESKQPESTKPEPTPSSAAAATSANKTPSAQDKTKAEQLKAEGNALISARQYSTAIEKYSQAISLDPSNAVYYSNRAAAWGAMGEHEEAVKDAERAVERDAGFVRGYSRLG
jgi:small glutamine-rich tetratricopeptide repeat-containing protein alpha